MSGAEFGLGLAIFLACMVEAIEALTIVLAVGTTRGWRWTLAGAAGALLTLAVIVGALGPAITVLPIGVLRVVVGVVLLAVGAQWLRKAVLRAAGRKALHDEQEVYRETALAAQQESRRPGVDRYALVSFAAGGHGLRVGIVAALLAVLLVGVAGVALRSPLSKVPENLLKLCVAVMLVSLGGFWTAEGIGLAMSEAELPVIVAGVLCGALLAARALRGTVTAERAGAGS